MQLQVDLDKLDQNAAVNKAGQVVGQFAKQAKNQLSDTALQPYDEVFGLQRFRETELIHGRFVQNVQNVSASRVHTLMLSTLQPNFLTVCPSCGCWRHLQRMFTIGHVCLQDFLFCCRG